MRLDESKQALSEEELLKLLKTTARRSHDAAKRSPIFACFSGNAPDFFKLQGGASKTGFLIDQALTALGICDRSKASVIGYTNANLAEREQTGALYVIMPEDKSRTWVAPDHDFYTSFEHAQKELRIKSVGNNNIREAFELLGDFDSWEELNELLKEGPSEAQRLKGDANEARLASFKKHHTGHSWFRSLFDLEDNGFKAYLPSQPIPAAREVWVSGSAIAILADRYDDLYKRKLV